MKLPRRKFLHLAVSAATLPGLSRGAWAQAYPNRPVRAVVAFAPGGVTDTFGRLMAQKLTEQFGKQFYVENIAGATGNIGTTQVAKAPPWPQSSPGTRRSASARRRPPCSTSRKGPCARLQ